MLIYVCGPYTAPTRQQQKQNIMLAEEAAKDILINNMIPIVPHKITSFWEFDRRFIHFTHSDWLNRFCLPLLKSCDGLFLCDGWKDSKGALMELKYAKENEMIIYKYNEERRIERWVF